MAMMAYPIPGNEKLMVLVNGHLQEAQRSNQLDRFIHLKDAIKAVTGQLPDDCKPLVGNLSVGYNAAWKGITEGLPIAAVKASKYVTKVYAVLRRGEITEREEKQLADLAPSEDYLHVLHTFVNSSCDLMTAVHRQLLQKANGEEAARLQRDADVIQGRMEVTNRDIFTATVAQGAAQSNITRSAFDLEYATLAITDKAAAKARMERELKEREATIPALNKAVMDHRDTQLHNYLDIGILKVHLGSTRNDNGERIAQAALQRELANIAQLKSQLNSVTTEDLEQRKTNAAAKMKLAEGVFTAETDKLSKLTKQYAADDKLLEAKCRELKLLFDAAGVSNIGVMQQVKVICDAAIDAYTSLHTSHGAMRTNVGQLSSDPDHFGTAVLSALNVMAYNDEVFHTSLVQNTARSLSLMQ